MNLYHSPGDTIGEGAFMTALSVSTSDFLAAARMVNYNNCLLGTISALFDGDSAK